jgi:hypothetical protein
MADYASEQTLQELLAEARAMNASLSRMASVLGRAPAGNGGAAAGGAAAGVASAAAGMAGLAKSISPASIALTALGGALSLVTKAFGVIGSIIGDLAGRLGNAVGAVVGFAKQMVDGTATLTSMVGMFGEMAKQIPLVGGALSGLISIVGFITKRMEDSFKMYKDLASSGMTFGGSLIEMRTQIQSAGLSVDEFAKISAKNGELFASMGGNVQKGGELFLKSQQAIVNGLKSEFAGLGMNAAEASGFLATYMKAQGNMSKDSLRDHRANAQGALELAQQTQFLSETTGKRREQIQEELEAATKEANWKAYLSGLSAEEAAKATAKLNFALAKGGKDAGDMLKTGMMTGVWQPMTAGQARTDAVLGGALTDMVKTVGTATGSTEQIASKMSTAGGKLANAVDVAYKDVGVTSALQIAQGKNGLISQELLTLRNNQMENGRIKSVEKIAADEAAARAKITEDLKKGDAAGVGKAQMDLKQAGLNLSTALDKIVGTLSGPIIEMLGKITKFLTDNSKNIEEWATKFANWFKPWVDKFTSVKSWDEFRAVMNDFWKDIKEKVGPILKDLWDSVKPVLASAVSNLFEMMWSSVKTALIPRLLRKDTEAEKEEDRQKDIAQRKKAVTDLEENILKTQAKIAEIKAKGGNTRYLEGALARQETALGNAKKGLAEAGGTPAPQPDQAKVARDWAYSIMTGQSKESDVPANIKDSVAAAKQDPTLIKQADDYKAQVAQQAAQEKARQEAAAQAAKNAASQPAPAATPAPPPSAAPITRQDSSASAANVLNTQLATLVRASLETAEHTKKTASILASNGNALRR